VIAKIGDAGEAKSDGGGEKEEGGEEAADEGGAEAEGGEEAAAEGDAEEAEAEEGEEGGADDGEAIEEEQERESAKAEGDSEEAKAEGAEGEEAAEGGAEGEKAADGGGEGKEAEGGGEGEEAAVAGAEGGGGETQAAAGTATRERPAGGNGDGRVKASPVARRMARDLGVELAQLEGTGPGGRIVKADVQAAAENGGAAQAEAPAEGRAETKEEPAKEEAPARDEKKKEPAKKEPERAEAGAKGEVQIEELTRLQQTVSRRMAESKATAPDFSIALTVDMTAAVELRERLKEISDPVPSFNDMVVKAAASALREHPRVNGAYRDGKFELYDKVNVGIAVAAMDALVVPTIFDADKKSLGQIARDARAVIGKVKDKTVTPPELSGGTFTVSNLGMFGIEHFTAIINPPQAAILTVGKLDKQPAVDDKGRVIARDQMTLTLVCDHRILYGAEGAQFLARVKDLLEQPLSLAL
jgi:pyruvate dehydrogenase E2 component (dihydrolipoamide acetyltransferase)